MKPLTFAILRQLSHRDFLSGEELAARLDVSRASVWQALEGLEALGLPLQRVRGRGYRLPHPIQWLDVPAIRSALAPGGDDVQLQLLDTVDSTNTCLMRQSAEGAPHLTCLAAEIQSAGRGRRGRAWQMEPGGALAFSLLWRSARGAGALSGLSLAVGVAAIRALRESGITEARLKWPNDILLGQGKLAGILIELQGDMLGPSAAVIGMGLNLRLSPRAREVIEQDVADLAHLPTPPERNRLLGTLLRHLVAVLTQFEHQGFPALRDEWQHHHAHQERPVRLLLPSGQTVEGLALGVAEDGSLQVRTARGVEHFASGEVSLREAT